MKKFKHVVITRFDYEDKVARDERMEIFKKYTLPSIKNQINGNFEWIFFSKKELPIDFKNKKFFNLEEYKEYKKELAKDYEFIIETRLDNDDVVSPDFISNIQTAFKEIMNDKSLNFDEFVIEPSGYRYDLRNDTFYEDILYTTEFSSPFLSLVYRLGSGKYVFDYSHGQMCREYPTRFINNRLWIQMIHNSNKLMNSDSEEVIASWGNKCDKPDWFKELK